MAQHEFDASPTVPDPTINRERVESAPSPAKAAK
jgi:hypothetical protein